HARVRARDDRVPAAREPPRARLPAHARRGADPGGEQPGRLVPGRGARPEPTRGRDPDRDVRRQRVPADPGAAVRSDPEPLLVLLVPAPLAVAGRLTEEHAMPATRSSLLSDELVRQLVAVGQVDIVVGLPTFNNASTVQP